jgi:hypothetical protein
MLILQMGPTWPYIGKGGTWSDKVSRPLERRLILGPCSRRVRFEARTVSPSCNRRFPAWLPIMQMPPPGG